MIKATLQLEETTLVGTRRAGSDLWDVEVSNPAMKQTIVMNGEQMAAVTGLALGTESGDTEWEKVLYPIAEEAIKELPMDLRPIP